MALIFLNPDRSFYLNEIVRHSNAGKGAVQRELNKLETAGLVRVQHIGNQKHFQANADCHVFQELRSIVVKTFGIKDVLMNFLSPKATTISLAFIYGSFAKGEATAQSDIDLMIISDELELPDLLQTLMPAEAQLGKQIQATLYRSHEFKQKQAGEFLRRVLAGPVIPLIGQLNEHKQANL
ncbi:nucleotidyltransferase domain-containing protein [Limnobacter sp.]|uniref:nucleotidyltransferase domain-containing protein n=1 Tax=Limnobacter sp. TaxID=2003368 RepID=UPI003518E73C